MAKGRSTTPETGGLGADGLIHLDLSGPYAILHTLVNPITEALRGSRDSAVVRALASHQCGPGSITGLGVICGLCLLLVLVLALRGFFSEYTGFSLSSETNISKFQFDLESVPN